MKIKQKNTKKLYIALAVVAVIITGLSYYVFTLNGNLFGWKFRSDETSSINMDPPTKEQVKAGEDTKQETVESDQGKPGTGDDTPTPDPSGALTVGFSAVNQNDGKLQVRIMIDEVLSSGECTLTLTNGNKTVTKTAAVYPTASITTCQGFDVPVSELSNGAWNVTIAVTSGDRNGQSTTSIQVN